MSMTPSNKYNEEGFFTIHRHKINEVLSDIEIFSIKKRVICILKEVMELEDLSVRCMSDYCDEDSKFWDDFFSYIPPNEPLPYWHRDLIRDIFQQIQSIINLNHLGLIEESFPLNEAMIITQGYNNEYEILLEINRHDKSDPICDIPIYEAPF